MNKLIITENGIELMTKLIEGTTNIRFTKVCSSAHDYSGDDVSKLVELNDIKQTIGISDIEKINDDTVEINVHFSNKELESGYFIKAVGLFCVDNKGNEILFGVSVETEHPDFVPVFNGRTPSGVEYTFNIVIGNAENVIVYADPEATVTRAEFNKLKLQKMDKVNPEGEGSFSMGRKTGSEVGTCSSVCGIEGEASSVASHAGGYNTIASGVNARSYGNNTIASGANSRAEGNNTTASGSGAHADGMLTKAIGHNSHASGLCTIARRNCETVIGKYNVDYQTPEDEDENPETALLFAVGNGTGEGERSNAFEVREDGGACIAGDLQVDGGINIDGNITLNGNPLSVSDNTKMDKNNPYGTGSFSLNRLINSAVGFYSFAEGNDTIASGNWGAHAEGNYTLALGNWGAHAEGERTIASGTASHVENTGTMATKSHSHAEGYETIANGENSHAQGFYTIASSECQDVSGINNIKDTNDRYLVIVGNGKYFNNQNFNSISDLNVDVSKDISVIDIPISINIDNNSSYKICFNGVNIMSSYNVCHIDYDESKNALYADHHPYYNITITSNNIKIEPKSNCPTFKITLLDLRKYAKPSNAYTLDLKGNGWFAGAVTSTGADYAEYIKPWRDGNIDSEDRTKYFVTVKNGFLEKANSSDYIVGITSTSPAIIGNNVNTGEHDGWSYVGMIGVLPLRDDGTCVPGGFAKCSENGIATKADNWECHKTFFVIERINDNVISVEMR